MGGTLKVGGSRRSQQIRCQRIRCGCPCAALIECGTDEEFIVRGQRRARQQIRPAPSSSRPCRDLLARSSRPRATCPADTGRWIAWCRAWRRFRVGRSFSTVSAGGNRPESMTSRRSAKSMTRSRRMEPVRNCCVTHPPYLPTPHLAEILMGQLPGLEVDQHVAAPRADAPAVVRGLDLVETAGFGVGYRQQGDVVGPAEREPLQKEDGH